MPHAVSSILLRVRTTQGLVLTAPEDSDLPGRVRGPGGARRDPERYGEDKPTANVTPAAVPTVTKTGTATATATDRDSQGDRDRNSNSNYLTGRDLDHAGAD